MLFISSINAQKGFRIEASIGPTLGDSSDYYYYTIQGNLYYFWSTSENINIGVASGALVFLGDASEDWCTGCLVDEYEPELWVPIAIAGRVKLSKKLSFGLDTGYAFLIHLFDEGNGFYLRPVITYNLKEKLALTCSFVSISNSYYSPSTINLGVNIGF